MSAIRVILVDDHCMVREGLAQVLADQDDTIRVVGQAARGDDALRMARETGVDVLVLDYTLPGLDGPAVTTQLLRDSPQVRVVIITMHENVHYVQKAMEAGALGFVVKSDAATELVKAIHAVSVGQTYISPRLADQVAQQRQLPKGRHVGLDKLSQREFELLRLMVRGMNLQECAKSMGISESTASTYRARLMNKLGLTHNAQIIRFGLENDVTG